MNKKEIENLKLIFSDCDVIDVDFSKWDKYVSFTVISDHYTNYHPDAERPILEIRFTEITKVYFEFFHHGDNVYKNDETKHYNWIVNDSTIEKTSSGLYDVIFSGNRQFPKVSLRCKETELIEIESKYYKAISPNWGDYESGLHRPNIKELFSLLTKRKS